MRRRRHGHGDDRGAPQLSGSPPAGSRLGGPRRLARAAGLGRAYRWTRRHARGACARTGERLLRLSESDVDRRERADNDHLTLLLRLSLPSDANCIDVGAHEGVFLSDMVRVAPQGRHIAYEPLPAYAAKLRREFPSVDVRCAALSDRAGSTSFQFVRNMPGMSGIERRPYPMQPDIEVLTVPTERLDDSLPAGFVPHLIKVDVEGAEMLVFDGARRTITEHRPVVVFEHGRGVTTYGDTTLPLFTFLTEDAGLRIFDLDGDGPQSFADFSRTPKWQFVAHR